MLFGHSGGGPTMSFYQALAENGVGATAAIKRLVPCNEDLGLPPADGIVFADAHPGQPVMVMRALMPVANEANPPNAPLIPISIRSIRRTATSRAACRVSRKISSRVISEMQAKRMNAIIDERNSRLERIKEGAYPYPDDDIVIIPRAGNPGAGPYGTIYINQLDPGIARMNTRCGRRRCSRTTARSSPRSRRASSCPTDVPKEALSFGLGTKVLTLRRS